MPYIALVGNKLDLIHMRAVKPEKHNFFADESNMYSYFVSAKQGDKVASTFYRIAADLAGVVLTDSEVEGSVKVLPANIVNHQQHDPATPQLVLKQNDDKCSLQ